MYGSEALPIGIPKRYQIVLGTLKEVPSGSLDTHEEVRDSALSYLQRGSR